MLKRTMPFSLGIKLSNTSQITSYYIIWQKAHEKEKM